MQNTLIKITKSYQGIVVINQYCLKLNGIGGAFIFDTQAELCGR